MFIQKICIQDPAIHQNHISSHKCIFIQQHNTIPQQSSLLLQNHIVSLSLYIALYLKTVSKVLLFCKHTDTLTRVCLRDRQCNKIMIFELECTVNCIQNCIIMTLVYIHWLLNPSTQTLLMIIIRIGTMHFMRVI